MLTKWPPYRAYFFAKKPERNSKKRHRFTASKWLVALVERNTSNSHSRIKSFQ